MQAKKCKPRCLLSRIIRCARDHVKAGIACSLSRPVPPHLSSRFRMSLIRFVVSVVGYLKPTYAIQMGQTNAVAQRISSDSCLNIEANQNATDHNYE